jgi:hypothetical protein
VREECSHHERVGEAHLAAVDYSVAGTLDHRQEVVVCRAGRLARVRWLRACLLHDELLDCAGHVGSMLCVWLPRRMVEG